MSASGTKRTSPKIDVRSERGADVEDTFCSHVTIHGVSIVG